MPNTLSNVDLAAMFDIDLAPSDNAVVDTGAAAMCSKCHGRGNFVGYTGRIIGKCFACDGSGLSHAMNTGEALATTQIDVSAIAAAFTAAHTNGIKRPKLRLDTFQFSRAPDTGRNAGSIYVKHSRSGEYLGKVTDGHFYKSRECTDPTKDAIVAVAADPATAAKAYGQKTGSCSCCGRELTEALSVELGIGPICREKFGW